MQRIKFIILFCATLLSLTTVVAQPNKILTFQKGDVVPNLEMKIYRGTSVQKVRLYDLKKKLLLLDLWGVNCSSCIKSFPHMLEMQKKFADDIQIITVTLNTKEEVENLWAKLKGHVPQKIIEAYRQLPSVVGDTALFNSFLKNSVPTHVWIDSTHEVKFITYGYSTNSEKIAGFLSGKRVHFNETTPQKIDFTKPLSWLNKDTGFLNSLQYYSFILSRIEHDGQNNGQVNAVTDSSTGKVVELSTVNMNIPDLYKMAYFPNKNPMSVFNDHLLLEVKDKDRFHVPKDVQKYFDWADANEFCLSIRVPSDKPELLYPSFKNLLDSYFHYQSKMEKRKVRCLVLKRITPQDRIKTKGGKAIYEMSVSDKGSFFTYRNEPMGDLFSNLQTLVYYQDSFIPFFDETNYKNNIDITIPWSDDVKDISFENVKKVLNKYGLGIVEEYRNLEMLVISDAL